MGSGGGGGGGGMSLLNREGGAIGEWRPKLNKLNCWEAGVGGVLHKRRSFEGGCPLDH